MRLQALDEPESDDNLDDDDEEAEDEPDEPGAFEDEELEQDRQSER